MPAVEPFLAFSTLGCPGWAALDVADRAREFGYDAVEWRGGPAGTVTVDWSQPRRRALRERMDAEGLRSLAVTAYTDLVAPHPRDRTRSLDNLRRHLDLAADLGATFVRVFIGLPSDDAGGARLAERAVGCLREAAASARDAGVEIGVEPHDAHLRAASVAPIVEAVADPAVGVIWDIGNAFSVGETPADGLAILGSWIRYVQLKDGVGRGDTWRLVPLGSGQVPLDSALAALVRRFAPAAIPPLSLEWERAWYPELEPPEVVLPAAAAWLRARDWSLTALAADEPRLP